jgi:transitional endoplasmic reticulum ATPase
MHEFKKGASIGNYVVLYPLTSREYTQTYCVADKNNFQFFMKVYDMNHIPVFLQNGEDPQELWAYTHLGLCDYLPRLIRSGRKKEGLTNIVYLVTKYFRGKLLSQYIEENGQLTQGEAQAIALALLKAIQHLHSHGVYHLDITPQNVLLEVTAEGTYTPKLFDLEYACERPHEEGTKFKAQRFEKADPYYSHTDLLASQTVSEADDLFSIGAILYTMLTGKKPWEDCPITSDMPFVEQHINMVRWRKDHSVDSLLKPLVSVHPPMFEAMARTMDGGITSEELERLLEAQLSEVGRKSRINVDVEALSKEKKMGFAEIAGMDELKQSLSQRVLWPLRHAEKALQYRLQLPNGILFYGPPGCGKTYFATKLAEELKWEMEFVSTASLGSAYQHETQGNIQKIFTKAEKYGHCVLCIDEIDGILSGRKEGSTNSSHNDEVNEFLVQLNECHKRGILVIGTTNRKDIIDPAALRAGRFDLLIEVKAPDLEMRKRLFEMYLANRPLAEDIDIAELAEMSDGYASSDVPFVVNEAALFAAIADQPISQTHLTNVIKNHPSSLDITKPNPIGFQ